VAAGIVQLNTRSKRLKYETHKSLAGKIRALSFGDSTLRLVKRQKYLRIAADGG
jgi:hypothetical protein